MGFANGTPPGAPTAPPLYLVEESIYAAAFEDERVFVVKVW